MDLLLLLKPLELVFLHPEHLLVLHLNLLPKQGGCINQIIDILGLLINNIVALTELALIFVFLKPIDLPLILVVIL